MFGGWLEKTKELAAQAQQAALEIDKKINESVGIPNEETTTAAVGIDQDDALNDAWGEEDDDIFDDNVKEKPLETENDDILSQKENGSEKEAAPPRDEKEEAEDDGVQSEKEGGGWDEEENLELEEDFAEPDREQVSSTSLPAVEVEKPHPSPELDCDKTEFEQTPSKDAATDKFEAEEEIDVIEEIDSPDGWNETEDDLDIVDETEQQNDEVVDAAVTEGTETVIPGVPVEPSAEEETGGQLDAQSEPAPDDLALSEVNHEVRGEPVVVDDQPAETLSSNSIESQKTSTADNAEEPAQNMAKPETDTTPVTDAVVGDVEQPAVQPESDGKLLQAHALLQQQMKDLRNRLEQRETQLFSKTDQLTQMQALHEDEKKELQQKIQETKEEAKRRIQKAKERVVAAETQLKSAASSHAVNADDASKQAEIITALREEGQKLALKQSEMEKSVRAARGEARELREKLEMEMTEKETALEKLAGTEAELRSTRDELVSARRGESQAGKLEQDMRKLKEEADMKAATILSLEQNVKELKQEKKELQENLQDTQKGAAVETEREQKKLRKEHNDAVADLANKLRTLEKESALREDALRQEVTELRKRWQDAVRRADALSMDVQSSTAPLLRQLESAERQNRARSSAWAELETSLRAELEDNVINNEKLSKERSEWKTKSIRLERASTEMAAELKTTKSNLEEKTNTVKKLEEKLEKLEADGLKMKEEWAEVERLANEGVSKVRSEMTQTAVENEERHQAQLKSLQAELSHEKEKRGELERQLEELVDKAGMIVAPEVLPSPVSSPPEVKLKTSTGQADILAGALNGLGDSDDESLDKDDDEDDGVHHLNGGGSFAAIAELTSRLKAATVELQDLRKTLAEAERTRDRMVEELAEARSAREKLPLFESRVRELTVENEQMTLEIQSLQEDIAEVRELYRTQLNVLLEEKAAVGQPPMENATTDPTEENHGS